MNEIVFENRNKSYGAYALRKGYNDNVIKGFMVSSLLFALAIVVPMVITKIKPIELPIIESPLIPLQDLVYEVILEKPKIVEPVKMNATPPPGGPISSAIITTVIDDTEDPNSNPKIEDPGTTDTGTNPDPGREVFDPNAGGGSDDGKSNEVSSNAEEVLVDHMPEFIGDINKYLAKHINYPRRALERGIHGTVYISFVVDQEGEVTDVYVQKGIGGGCDEEALDVVKKMPAWKPGRNKANKPVRVRYSVPVSFKIE